MGGRAGRRVDQCLEQLGNAVPNADRVVRRSRSLDAAAPAPDADAAAGWVWADGSCRGPRMVAMPSSRQHLDTQPLFEETFVHAQQLYSQLLHEADRAKLLGAAVRATQRCTRAGKAGPSQRAQQLEHLHLQIDVSIVAEAVKQADQNRQVARGRIRRLGAKGVRGRDTCVVHDDVPLAAAVPTHAIELRQALAHECKELLISCGATQPGRNQPKKGFGIAQLLEVRVVVQSLQRREHGERVANDGTGKGEACLARDGEQGTNERASITCQPARTVWEGCNNAHEQRHSV